LVTIILVSLAAVILIVSGIKNRASVGIFIVAAMIFFASRLGLTSLAQMGLVPPENWLNTVLLGLVVGTGLSFLSIIVIQPLSEHFTKRRHDVSIVEGVRGNTKQLITWLLVIWTLVAFGEEILFHGFLLSQVIKLLGTSMIALVMNVVFNSIVFGLAHAYQGRSGAWSTGFIGACLCICYILSGYNLWLPIFVHGAIDTVELILMSRGADTGLRELIWKRSSQPVN
jgi:membrane protease YdiL (CAAX protease family)